MTETSGSAAHNEPHTGRESSKLNWLRAAVLGANDGIVSVAALVVGVAGATDSAGFIFTAGIAGVIAGALSMAVGEYVSVSSQSDTEKALIEKERSELATEPGKELEELTVLYQAKGLSRGTAATVAQELTAHDALAAHLEAELNIHQEKISNPWHAAFASAASFVAGAALPIIAITVPPPEWRIPTTFVSVALALALTGSLSAHVGNASKRRATMRVVLGGALAMAITFGIGRLFGVAGI
jgi:VIT1/CCC1 family predicted Fe2+/Mn2+ transporter